MERSNAFVINESLLAAEYEPLRHEVGPDTRRFIPLSGPAQTGPYYAGISDDIRPATKADFEKYRVSGPEYYGVTE